MFKNIMEQLIADIDSRDFTIEGYDKIISNLNEISLICGEHVFFYNNRDIKVNGFTLNGTFFNKNGPFYRSDVVKVVELYSGVLEFCSVLLIEDISQENDILDEFLLIRELIKFCEHSNHLVMINNSMNITNRNEILERAGFINILPTLIDTFSLDVNTLGLNNVDNGVYVYIKK